MRWSNLAAEKDLTSEIEQVRFDDKFYGSTDSALPGKLRTLRGGWLDYHTVFGFDLGYFRMSSQEAEAMDPQVRLLLMTVPEAYAEAGLIFNHKKTACFMGVTAHEYLPYATLHPDQMNTGKFTNTGTNACMTANRLSHEFDFRAGQWPLTLLAVPACVSAARLFHMHSTLTLRFCMKSQLTLSPKPCQDGFFHSR